MMNCGRMPLFPQNGDGRSRVHMPLFGGDGCGCAQHREDCQLVRIQNPACPSEYADVELCVDAGGNLSICVHRPSQSDCGCASRRSKCKSSCGWNPWAR